MSSRPEHRISHPDGEGVGLRVELISAADDSELGAGFPQKGASLGTGRLTGSELGHLGSSIHPLDRSFSFDAGL
jgi:hypothetical protein